MRPRVQALPIALIASLAIGILPSVGAFWLRFLWKNELSGPNGVHEGNAGLTLYLLTGNAPLLSKTHKFPVGTPECQLMQDFVPNGPQDPVPGMISILNAPRAGRKVDYLFFFEDEVCGTTPALFIKLEPPRGEESTSGNSYVINLLDNAIPAMKSWKQGDLDDPIDRGIVGRWDKPEQRDPEHPSIVSVNMHIPSQESGRRLEGVVRGAKIEPSTFSSQTDVRIESFMGAQLMVLFGHWLKNEELFRKQQEQLDIDFGSEGFNFIPNDDFSLGADEVADHMVREESRRVGGSHAINQAPT
ncbi:hypothetical protein TWF281_004414 [Arthrobotrys megalospora]